MKTQFAANKTLLAPSITPSTGGTIVAGTRYFWHKRRNRSGYSAVSPVATVVIASTGRITINSTEFAVLGYEDAHESLFFVSATNDFSTARAFAKYTYFASDEITLNTPANIVINSDLVINGATTYAIPNDVAALTGLVTGYRVLITSTGFCYEFVAGSTAAVDNVTILTNTGGRWFKTTTATLNELDNSDSIDVIGIDPDLVISASLKNINQDAVPIKYWVVNDSGASLSNLTLNLTEYANNAAIDLTFNVKILGYLNVSSFAFDITGINNLNVYQEYPTIDISFNKPLPNGSAAVIEVLPTAQLLDSVAAQSFISLYPKLVNYALVREPTFWAEKVEDIATLKALNPVQYKDGQVRTVMSLLKPYLFDADSILADNGDTVIIPNGAPPTGRWVVFTPAYPDGSIPLSALAPEVAVAFGVGIKTTTVTLNAPGNYSTNLDDLNDYLILKAPPTDIGNTISTINYTATLANNETKALILELVQSTGVLAFDVTILFPGGVTPILSGNAKTDLLLFTIRKDSSGVVKKRAFIVQTDIG